MKYEDLKILDELREKGSISEEKRNISVRKKKFSTNQGVVLAKLPRNRYSDLKRTPI